MLGLVAGFGLAYYAANLCGDAGNCAVTGALALSALIGGPVIGALVDPVSCSNTHGLSRLKSRGDTHHERNSLCTLLRAHPPLECLSHRFEITEVNDSQRRPYGQPERRLQVRVQLSEPLMARDIGLADTFLVLEASLGGFSVQSDLAFSPGSEHHFRVASPTGQVAVVTAICRYCTKAPDSSDSPAYLVGFQFTPQPTKRLGLFLGAIAMDAPAG